MLIDRMLYGFIYLLCSVPVNTIKICLMQNLQKNTSTAMSLPELCIYIFVHDLDKVENTF